MRPRYTSSACTFVGEDQRESALGASAARLTPGDGRRRTRSARDHRSGVHRFCAPMVLYGDDETCASSTSSRSCQALPARSTVHGARACRDPGSSRHGPLWRNGSRSITPCVQSAALGADAGLELREGEPPASEAGPSSSRCPKRPDDPVPVRVWASATCMSSRSPGGTPRIIRGGAWETAGGALQHPKESMGREGRDSPSRMCWRFAPHSHLPRGLLDCSSVVPKGGGVGSGSDHSRSAATRPRRRQSRSNSGLRAMHPPRMGSPDRSRNSGAPKPSLEPIRPQPGAKVGRRRRRTALAGLTHPRTSKIWCRPRPVLFFFF